MKPTTLCVWANLVYVAHTSISLIYLYLIFLLFSNKNFNTRIIKLHKWLHSETQKEIKNECRYKAFVSCNVLYLCRKAFISLILCVSIQKRKTKVKKITHGCRDTNNDGLFWSYYENFFNEISFKNVVLYYMWIKKNIVCLKCREK